MEFLCGSEESIILMNCLWKLNFSETLEKWFGRIEFGAYLLGAAKATYYWELGYEISNLLKPIQNFWRHLSDMPFPIIIIHTRICMKFDESERQTWSDRFRRELVWPNEMVREDRKINSTRLRETKRKEDKEKIMGIKERH